MGRHHGYKHTSELRGDKGDDSVRSDASIGIGQRSGNCHCRVRERRRCGKPISRGNVESDRVGNSSRRARETAQDRAHEPKGGDELGEPFVLDQYAP
jgi:hypothetical protein